MQLFVIRPQGITLASEDEDIAPWMAWHGIPEFPMPMRTAANFRRFFVRKSHEEADIAFAFVGAAADFCSVLHDGQWSVYRDFDDAATDIYGMWPRDCFGRYEPIPCLIHS